MIRKVDATGSVATFSGAPQRTRRRRRDRRTPRASAFRGTSVRLGGEFYVADVNGAAIRKGLDRDGRRHDAVRPTQHEGLQRRVGAAAHFNLHGPAEPGPSRDELGRGHRDRRNGSLRGRRRQRRRRKITVATGESPRSPAAFEAMPTASGNRAVRRAERDRLRRGASSTWPTSARVIKQIDAEPRRRHMGRLRERHGNAAAIARSRRSPSVSRGGRRQRAASS